MIIYISFPLWGKRETEAAASGEYNQVTEKTEQEISTEPTCFYCLWTSHPSWQHAATQKTTSRLQIRTVCLWDFQNIVSLCGGHLNKRCCERISIGLWVYLGFPGGSIENSPAMQEIQVQSLGQEDPLEEGMATHSSILTWRIPWTEEPGGLQSMRSQRIRHNWVANTNKWI